MFLGEYEHCLDDKGRLILPAKMRTALAGGVILTVGMENCLFIIPKVEWANWEAKIRSMPLTKNTRRFQRFILGGAVEQTPTKQGRVSIPENLRAYAKLTKDVVVIGVSNRVEVWDRERWRSERSEAESSYSDIAEDLELGI